MISDEALSLSIESPATLREVGIHLATLSRKMDRVDSKLDAMLNVYVTRADFEEHLKIDEDHESRLRSIEDSRSKIIGIATAVGVGGSIIVQLISNAFLK